MAKIIKKITGLKPNQNYLVSFKAKNTELSAVDEPYPSIRVLTPVDSSIPGTIDNTTFFIYGNYKSVMFVFEPTSDIDVSKYKYELYSDAAGTNLISSGFATASVFTLDVPGNSNAADDASAQTDVKYYGRIKAVDTSGNEGGWTPTSGLKESSETVLIESSHIRNLTASKITAGTINAHEIILKQQGTQTTISAPANMAILRSSDYNGSYNNGTNQWSAGTSGWVIAGNGYAEFGAAAIRGGLKAESVWIDANNRWNRNATDTATVNQFKAGSATKYIYFDGTNVVFTGDLSAAGGTFSGDLSAAGGTFSGDLSAAGGTFSGDLSAAGGTFSGDLSAAGGTFSGDLSAAGGTFSGDLSAAGGTFSGDISAASGTFTGDLSGSTITGGSINIGGGTFQVNSSGQLTATSGTFSGSLSGASVTGATGTFSGLVSGGEININNEFRVLSDGAVYARNMQLDYGFSYRSEQFPVNNAVNAQIFTLGSGIQRISQPASRREFKENIQDISQALEIVNRLRPRVFSYNEKYYGDIDPSTDQPWTENAINMRSLVSSYGFIVEEIQEINPQLVSYRPTNTDIPMDQVGGAFDISTWTPTMWKESEIIALLTKAVQELSDKIEDLESRI